jgi:hypothetical protein
VYALEEELRIKDAKVREGERRGASRRRRSCGSRTPR